MTEDFRRWALTKARSSSPSEMVEDTFFVSRLLTDIIWGRSKRFNRSKETGTSMGLSHLMREYQIETGNDMGLLICSKCKGSLIVFKGNDGKTTYKCNNCGQSYDKRPK